MKLLISIFAFLSLATTALANDYLGSKQTGTDYSSDSEIKAVLPYEPGVTDACPGCANKFGWNGALTDQAQSYKDILTGTSGAHGE